MFSSLFSQGVGESVSLFVCTCMMSECVCVDKYQMITSQLSNANASSLCPCWRHTATSRMCGGCTQQWDSTKWWWRSPRILSWSCSTCRAHQRTRKEMKTVSLIQLLQFWRPSLVNLCDKFEVVYLAKIVFTFSEIKVNTIFKTLNILSRSILLLFGRNISFPFQVTALFWWSGGEHLQKIWPDVYSKMMLMMVLKPLFHYWKKATLVMFNEALPGFFYW